MSFPLADERPYRCNQCGLAFRESGALTRHLKSLTPCTEKIRFSQCKEILVGKDGARKGISRLGNLWKHLLQACHVKEMFSSSLCGIKESLLLVEIQPSPPDPEKEHLPVVSVVEAGEEIIQIQVVDENGQV